MPQYQVCLGVHQPEVFVESPPTAEDMARLAFRTGGFPDHLMVPQVMWVKDYPGQVTNGRIGRPVISYASVDWLPSAIGEEVKRLVKQKEQAK